ncbi:hypothetical protein ACNS7O_12320 [Haloferacaceae archaeon DSL9]
MTTNDTKEHGLIELAERVIEAVRETESGDEVLDSLDADFEDLAAVADELEDVLSTINVEKLPDAINLETIPEIVSEGADAAAEGDFDGALNKRTLSKLIDIAELLDSIDVRTFLEQKGQLEDAVEEAMDVDVSKPSDSESVDDADGSGLDSLLNESGELIDEVQEDLDDFDLFDDEGGLTPELLEKLVRSEGDESDEESDGEFGIGDVDTEQVSNVDQYVVAVQAQLSESVEEFRQKIIEAHAELAKIREETEDMFEPVGQPNSRNPTAVSSMPRKRGDMGGRSMFSTVPKNTMYSNVPNHKRIYGARFMNEREQPDEEETDE